MQCIPSSRMRRSAAHECWSHKHTYTHFPPTIPTRHNTPPAPLSDLANGPAQTARTREVRVVGPESRPSTLISVGLQATPQNPSPKENAGGNRPTPRLSRSSGSSQERHVNSAPTLGQPSLQDPTRLGFVQRALATVDCNKALHPTQQLTRMLTHHSLAR